MSYDLDVISTLSDVVQWGDVLVEWRRMLGAASIELLGHSPKPVDIHTDEIVDVSQRFKPDHAYGFDLPVSFTTTLDVYSGCAGRCWCY